MKYSILFLVLFSCNPAKKIQRQQKQFDAIGRQWLVKNPTRIDTSTFYLPGKTVTTERIDTVFSTLVDTSIFLQTLPGKIQVQTITKVITKSVHDTLQITVKDEKLLSFCQSDLTKVQSELSQSQIREAKGKKWMWICFSLIAIILFCVYLQFKKWII